MEPSSAPQRASGPCLLPYQYITAICTLFALVRFSSLYRCAWMHKTGSCIGCSAMNSDTFVHFQRFWIGGIFSAEALTHFANGWIHETYIKNVEIKSYRLIFPSPHDTGCSKVYFDVCPWEQAPASFWPERSCVRVRGAGVADLRIWLVCFFLEIRIPEVESRWFSFVDLNCNKYHSMCFPPRKPRTRFTNTSVFYENKWQTY